MSKFHKYEIKGTTEQKVIASLWNAATGLQSVDALEASRYLVKIAKEHIEGRITFETVKENIFHYYREVNILASSLDYEADMVSIQIVDILLNKTFLFDPNLILEIHKQLFQHVYEFAGYIRTYNFVKDEWILNENDSVNYEWCDRIKQSLAYEFKEEKNFDYASLSSIDKVRHITKFISNLWQIHPFEEGNTRTIAVFTIMYLKHLGFTPNLNVFGDNSWYFRNALVRANFNELTTQEFLDMFFDNLIFNGTHKLNNKHLHIDWVKKIRSL